MADFPVTKTDEEWRKILTPEQYQILRQHATERPGSCALNTEKRAGTFSCAGCGQDLFTNDTKFNSGTGWPSFYAPHPGAIGTHTDQHLRHDAHRSALLAVRRTSRPRVPRRPAADRPALLHQRRGAELQAEVALERDL